MKYVTNFCLHSQLNHWTVSVWFCIYQLSDKLKGDSLSFALSLRVAHTDRPFVTFDSLPKYNTSSLRITANISSKEGKVVTLLHLSSHFFKHIDLSFKSVNCIIVTSLCKWSLRNASVVSCWEGTETQNACDTRAAVERKGNNRLSSKSH